MASDEIIIRIKTEGQEQFINDLKKSGVAVERVGTQSEQTQKKVSKSQGIIGKGFKSLGAQVAAFGATIGAAFSVAAISRFAAQSAAAFREFDASLKDLQAITGLAGQDLDRLSDAAKRLSGESLKSASDVLTAFKLIGSAKPELLQNVDALENLTEKAIVLSEASGLSLPEAATNLGNSLNALQLPAEEAGRLINVLAAASQQGAKEIPFVADALSKFGGVAAQAGVEVEESVAAVEVLGKAIPEASIVGTSLRNVFIKLQVAAAEQGREFKSLGDELERLAPLQTNVTELTKRFGDRNLLAIQTLIAQREELKNLQDGITGTNTAYEQQAIVLASAQAQVQRFQNALKLLKVNVGEALVVRTAPLLQGLTNIIDRINDTRTASERLADEVSDLNEQYQAQVRQTQKTNESVDDLVAQYNELQKEASDGKDVQAELSEVMEDIVRIVPSAATEFDEYGNVLAINVGRIDAARLAQEELNKALNEELIIKTTEQYQELEKRVDQLRGSYEFWNETNKTAGENVQDVLEKSGGWLAALSELVPEVAKLTGVQEFLSKTTQSTTAELQKTNDERLRALLLLRELNPSLQLTAEQEADLADFVKRQAEARANLNDTQKALIDAYAAELGILPSYTQAQLKLAQAWKAAAAGAGTLSKEQQKLLDELEKARQRNIIALLSANAAEEKAINDHYDELRDQAIKLKLDTTEIEAERQKSLLILAQQQYDEGIKAYKDFSDKLKALQLETNAEIAANTLDPLDDIEAERLKSLDNLEKQEAAFTQEIERLAADQVISEETAAERRLEVVTVFAEKRKAVNDKASQDVIDSLKREEDAFIQFRDSIESAISETKIDIEGETAAEVRANAQKRIEEIGKLEEQQLAKANELLDQGKITFAEFEKRKTEIARQAAQEREKVLKESLETQRKIFEDFQAEFAQTLNAAAASASGIDLNNLIDTFTKLGDTFSNPTVENYEKALIGVAAGVQTLNDFETAISEQRLARLERQRQEGEITEKEFARRRAEILRQQAIYQKAVAISQALINTALGITENLGNPVLIALTSAIGAAQVALIAGQPIPALPGFAEGTKGSQLAPPGMKWVGERGRELVVDSGGYNIINNQDSEKLMRILGGYGIPVQFNSTEAELARPINNMTTVTQEKAPSRNLDWNPLISSNDQNRYSLGKKLDRINGSIEVLNRSFRKRGLNARI